MFAVFDPLLQVFANAWPPDTLFGVLTALNYGHDHRAVAPLSLTSGVWEW